jgi:major cell surface glycoprotein (TIGR04216 family)
MEGSAVGRSWLLVVLLVGVLVLAAPALGSSREPVSAETPVAMQLQSPAGEAVIRDINGQVAVEDGTVAVRGTARGPEQVLVFFVDRRGGYSSTILQVGSDDVFEEDNVPLVTLRGESMSEGLVVAGVFAAGRDGVVGDGEIAGFRRADVESLDENTRQQIRERLDQLGSGAGLTQRQVLELLFSESVGEAGSDDLILEDTFVLTDGQTTIENVSTAPRSDENGTSTPRSNQTSTPATGTDAESPSQRNDTYTVTRGERLVVSGLTNRKPDDNTIFVEAIDGPTPEAFGVASTSSWETDGRWSVDLETDGVEPGTYVVEADDGDDSDRVEVAVLPRQERNQTVTQTSTATPSRTASPSPAASSPTPDRTSPTETAGARTGRRLTPTGETTADGPGFGGPAAVLALLVGTLVLVHRRRQ